MVRPNRYSVPHFLSDLFGGEAVLMVCSLGKGQEESRLNLSPYLRWPFGATQSGSPKQENRCVTRQLLFLLSRAGPWMLPLSQPDLLRALLRLTQADRARWRGKGDAGCVKPNWRCLSSAVTRFRWPTIDRDPLPVLCERRSPLWCSYKKTNFSLEVTTMTMYSPTHGDTRWFQFILVDPATRETTGGGAVVAASAVAAATFASRTLAGLSEVVVFEREDLAVST